MTTSSKNNTHVEKQCAHVWERLTGEVTQRYHTMRAHGELRSPRALGQQDIQEYFQGAGLSAQEAEEEAAVFALHAVLHVSEDL